MDHLKIFAKIKKAIEDKPLDVIPYMDAFSLIRDYGKENFRESHDMNHWLRDRYDLGLNIAVANSDWKAAERFDGGKYRSLLYSAPHYFEDYLMAIEYGKPLSKQFYKPRMHYLKRYVNAYQMILDGELDFLSMSIIKRGGKSQLGINFVDMISGKYPNKSTLMEGTGRDLVKSFYRGTLEYLDPKSDYHYYDIFPDVKISETSAETMTFNLNEKSRFPTVMCRSIDSTQVGLSEATNLLYLDDCVEGREEAKNRVRLDAKWEVISGDVLGRAIEGTPIVICGTRYSLYDPIGRMQETMERQGKRMLVIETPALDPITDESNFMYIRDGKEVFTTQYFRDQREMLSAEQFESEFQQQPFEAKGILFPVESLNRYFELPVDKEPDSIVAVCDTADSGSDSCSMPIAAIYGDEVYIIDVVFDDSPPEITKSECARALINNNVVSVTFESNNAGTYFARDVNELIDQQGRKISVRTKRTISNKQTRIEFASDMIIKNFYFKDPSTYARGSQYWNFMKELTTYTRSGKVAHDDAPDSLALLENELRVLIGAKVEIMPRFF